MMKSILTLTLLSSLLCVSTYAECTRNLNETVTCSESKLMWQDDESAKSTYKIWSDAIKYCEDLTFAGYSDWRLPNKNELLSIVDRSKYDHAVNTSFRNVSSSTGRYNWSSTSYARDTSEAWWMSLDDGRAFCSVKSRKLAVRCVRDAK